MSKIKYFIKQSWLLIVASFCFGLLIAVTNAAWSPRIIQNEIDKLNSLMGGLISEAENFEVVVKEAEVGSRKGKVVKTDIYRASGGDGEVVGFAFVAVGSGFADKIKLVIAVDEKCEKFFGFKVLASNETPGFGSKIKEAFFGDQFKGVAAGQLELVKAGDPSLVDSEIVAVSGATVSSDAVVKIFNSYIEQIKETLRAKGLVGDGR